MSSLTFYSLGGIGDVTKNLYVYETDKDLIIVDCGIGFPDSNMLGIDLVLPDISSLLEKRNKIRGIVLTHAHEDHIGALPYIWPKLKVPIYGTELTAAFVENKMRDFSLNCRVNIVDYRQPFCLGDFLLEYLRINHSVPNAANILITTSAGTFYHGSDYKFDLTPLDGKTTDFGRIAQAGEKGVLCLMSDCLRSEKEGITLSEKVVEEQLLKEIDNCHGKFIVTAHSSDIYRWQMVVNVARKKQRKLVFAGRSVEQAVQIGRKLGYIDIDETMILDPKKVKTYPAKFVCVLAAGSQGQPYSAIARIANNEHQDIKIKPGDMVVFSADPIPGNENAVHETIDALTKLGANVSYSEVDDDLHVSGHAASYEMKLLMSLTKPKYIVPIGGTYRQMKRYQQLANSLGFADEQVLLLDTGQQVIFQDQKVTLGKKIELKNILIDGLGIGDVSSIVLRDRQQLSQDGVVVAVLSVKASSGELVGMPDILSRGFVFMKDSETLIRETQNIIVGSVGKERGRVYDWGYLRKKIETNLANFFYKKTQRRPMILSVIVEV